MSCTFNFCSCWQAANARFEVVLSMSVPDAFAYSNRQIFIIWLLLYLFFALICLVSSFLGRPPAFRPDVGEITYFASPSECRFSSAAVLAFVTFTDALHVQINYFAVASTSPCHHRRLTTLLFFRSKRRCSCLELATRLQTARRQFLSG